MEDFRSDVNRDVIVRRTVHDVECWLYVKVADKKRVLLLH